MDGQQLDNNSFMERVGVLADSVRGSSAYPAIVAGVAGAAAGALMATLIASRVSRRSVPRHLEKKIQEAGAAAQQAGQGWTAREIVELATIGVTLLRQVQDWYAQRQQAKYS